MSAIIARSLLASTFSLVGDHGRSCDDRSMTEEMMLWASFLPPLSLSVSFIVSGSLCDE